MKRIDEVTPYLRRFWLRLETPLLNFVPGKYCTLGVDGIYRPYSVASVAGSGREVELFVKLIPENQRTPGSFTPKLWKLRSRDPLIVFPKSKGIFTLDPEFSDHIFIASGTGVVPFISILRDRLLDSSDRNRFFVFVGASFADEMVYDRELRELSRRFPQKLVRYVGTVSRPDESRNSSWRHDPDRGREVGRVDDVMKRYINGCGMDIACSQPPDCHSALLYLCGHPMMIETMKTRYCSNEVSPLLRWDFKEEAFWTDK